MPRPSRSRAVRTTCRYWPSHSIRSRCRRLSGPPPAGRTRWPPNRFEAIRREADKSLGDGLFKAVGNAVARKEKREELQCPKLFVTRWSVEARGHSLARCI